MVKAQTRIHTRASDPLSFAAASPTTMLDDKDHRVNVAGAGGERNKDPKPEDLDAKMIWQDALAKGVDDPGLIIACADFLAQQGKWDHAAEFLKADLRQGIVVRPWVYKSLAIALRESGGQPRRDRAGRDVGGRAGADGRPGLPGRLAGHGRPTSATTAPWPSASRRRPWSRTRPTPTTRPFSTPSRPRTCRTWNGRPATC